MYRNLASNWDNGKKSEIGNPSNSGLILEHITALTEVRILSETVEKP